MSKVKKISAREILDSRGIPTLEVDLTLADPKHTDELIIGRAIASSGPVVSEHEVVEARDQDPRRHFGKGVLSAVENVTQLIAPALVDREFNLQTHFDDALRELDGTPNKSKLGGNTLLAVSMAFCRAQSHEQRVPCYRNIANLFGSPIPTLPIPQFNLIQGGKLAQNGLAIQEFMIVPAGFETYREAYRAGAEIYQQLRRWFIEQGLSTLVNETGAFTPHFGDEKPHEQALQAIIQATEDCGYKPGTEIQIALGCSAGNFADGRGQYLIEHTKRKADELASLYIKWATHYPIISLEDPFAPHEWDQWTQLNAQIGSQCQLAGEDLFISNTQLLLQGVQKKAANAILVKPSQCGTVTETMETIKLAKDSQYFPILSQRAGETEDNFITELVVGTCCPQLKAGALSRMERVARYNHLLRIEEQLGKNAPYNGSLLLERFS